MLKVEAMNGRRKQLFWVLLLVAAAGCAGPSIEKTPVLSPTGDEFASAQEQPALTEASPQASPTETTAESHQTVFDPEGLSIGPGAGFVVLDDPEVIPGNQATWLDPEELVMGVAVGDEARAYPISQMAYHHIANDQIDGEPYLVTY